MYRPGRGEKRVSTTSCHLPLNRRIPESLAARLGYDVSYSDHEAVTSVIKVDSVTAQSQGDISWSKMCAHLGG